MECREAEDPVCASLPDIKSILELINEQNRHHILMFSQEGEERQAAGLATSLHL